MDFDIKAANVEFYTKFQLLHLAVAHQIEKYAKASLLFKRKEFFLL